jgi:hypothetical protein
MVPQWYHDAITANDEAPLLAACPDHYLSRTRPDGRQEVIETTGGAPVGGIRHQFRDEPAGGSWLGSRSSFLRSPRRT